jgi:hypothetical protein
MNKNSDYFKKFIDNQVWQTSKMKKWEKYDNIIGEGFFDLEEKILFLLSKILFEIFLISLCYPIDFCSF